MLKEAKNRGAGLVTVVVVLAVASILLSGAVFLSFSHYKRVIQREVAEQELAEIELLVKLICLELDSNATNNDIADALKNGGLVGLYYEVSFSEPVTLPLKIDRVTINTGNDDKLFVFSCGGTSKTYLFKNESGKWTAEVKS